ncbi:MAG: GIY-YIG nuclease family protein [Peptococcaceae bacterium]
MDVSYLYIIECKNGSFYTGITNDLLQRYQEHLAGKGSKYCRAFKVRVIKAAWQFPVKKSKLIALENMIQNFTKAKKSELINNPQTIKIPVQDLDLDFIPLIINIPDFLKNLCPCSANETCSFHGICSQCIEIHLTKLKKPPQCFQVNAKWVREVARNLKLRNLHLLAEW